jgi:hypothetical protein
MERNKVYAEFCSYNPAIFVPELNKVIFGYESWWSEITTEEELNNVITDHTIENVWYVKLLKSMLNANKEK